MGRMNHTSLTTLILTFTSTCPNALLATAVYASAKKFKVSLHGRYLIAVTRHGLFLIPEQPSAQAPASVVAPAWTLAQVERLKISRHSSVRHRQAGLVRLALIVALVAR